ncbi:hypothetical protein, partial [Morganella sp. GD04133]|uniref:hypothetical protein n=1 Tax=Morganella sp. GD04133 TaxID=2975435 RepID=UPI0024474B53
VATFAAVAGLLRCCEAAYITFPHLVSSIYFQTFHLVISADFASCAVTTDAHYREFLSDRKG